jgi:hypothetical protein
VQTFASIVGMDFAPNGTLYAVDYIGNIMTINPLNASSGQLFSIPENFSGDIAMLDSNTMYGSIDGANGSDLVRINVSAQTYVNLGNIVPGQGVWGLDFDSSGNLIAVVTSGDVPVSKLRDVGHGRARQRVKARRRLGAANGAARRSAPLHLRDHITEHADDHGPAR